MHRFPALLVAQLLFLAAQPMLSFADETAMYDVIMLQHGEQGNNWHALRYHTRSGKSWELDDNFQWVPVRENGVVKEGSFTVVATKRGDRWEAIRFDRLTGDSWVFTTDSWSPITVYDEKAAWDELGKLTVQGLREKSKEYYENAKYALATAAIRKALSIEPNKAADWRLLGDICYEGEAFPDWVAGVEAYSKTIELDADDPYPYTWRAVLYTRIGEPEKAKSDEKKAQELRTKKSKEKGDKMAGDKSKEVPPPTDVK